MFERGCIWTENGCIQGNLKGVKYLDKDEIAKRIVDREDIIGRNDKFKKIDLDNSFPEYLIKNLNNFKDWIV